MKALMTILPTCRKKFRLELKVTLKSFTKSTKCRYENKVYRQVRAS